MMDRREFIAGLMAGLTAPKLLAREDLGEYYDSIASPEADAIWAVPRDHYLECPDGLSFLAAWTEELAEESRIVTLHVERPNGDLVLMYHFNVLSGFIWMPPIESQIIGPVRVWATEPVIFQTKKAWLGLVGTGSPLNAQ